MTSLKKNKFFNILNYGSLFVFNLILILSPISTIQNYLLLFEIVGLVFLLAFQLIKSYHSSLPKLSFHEPAVLFLIAYFIFAIISFSWTNSHLFSNVAIITQSALLFGFGIAYFWNIEHRNIQQKVFILIALGFALSTHYHFFVKNEMGNFFGNSNTYAAFMVMLLTPLYCRFVNQAIEKKPLYITGSLIFIITLATGFIYSRGGLLTLVINLSLLSIVFLWHKQTTTIISLVKLLIILFLIPPLVYLLLQQNTQATQFAESKVLIEGFKTTGQVGRGVIWATGWQMFLDKPILGWGLGVFQLLFPQYKHGMVLEAGHFAYNDYLQILIELGIFGFLFIIGFVFSFLFAIFQAAKRANTSENRQTLSYGIACLGVLIHSFFDFNLYRLPILLLIGVYLGLFFRTQSSVAQTTFIPKNNFSKSKYYGSIAVASMIVFVWLSSFGMFFYFMNKTDSMVTMKQKMETVKIATLFYSRSSDYESLQAAYWMNQLFAIDKQSLGQEKMNAAGKEILAILDKGIRKNPLGADNYLKKAQVLTFMQPKKNEEAILKNFDLALKRAPDNLSIRSQYVSYLISLKKHQEALKILWGAWDRVYQHRNYQEIKNYLTMLLHYNRLYGKQIDNAKVLKLQTRISSLLNQTKAYTNIVFQ